MAASGTTRRGGVVVVEGEGEAEVAEVDDDNGEKRRRKMLLLLSPPLLLSTIFHFPGLYSSASAASWATKEPEWRRALADEGGAGKGEDEEEDGRDASSSSTLPASLVELGADAPNSRDEAPTRAPPVPISRWIEGFRELAYLRVEKSANAAQQQANAPKERKKREREAKVKEMAR